MQRIEESVPCTLAVYYVQQAIQNGHLHCLDLASDAAFPTPWPLIAHSSGTFLIRKSPVSGAMGTKPVTSLWKDEGWHLWHVCISFRMHPPMCPLMWVGAHVVNINRKRGGGGHPTVYTDVWCLICLIAESWLVTASFPAMWVNCLGRCCPIWIANVPIYMVLQFKLFAISLSPCFNL